MFGLALGYAAVCLLVPLWLLKALRRAGCGVRLACRGLQERHFYSRDNFKLNRAAALAERPSIIDAHRFRLCQQFDASSHLSDSTHS